MKTMYIRVKVTPNAKKETVVQSSDSTFTICVKEPAERNQANKRVRELLMAKLGLSKGEIKLISGHQSSHKTFSVSTG